MASSNNEFKDPLQQSGSFFNVNRNDTTSFERSVLEKLENLKKINDVERLEMLLLQLKEGQHEIQMRLDKIKSESVHDYKDKGYSNYVDYILKSVEEKELRVVLEQCFMFVGMFIECFEGALSYLSDVAIGRASVRQNISSMTKVGGAMGEVCTVMIGFNVVSVLMKLISKLNDEQIKKKVKNIMQVFPPNISRIHDELTIFGFEMFRSYESLLANPDSANCHTPGRIKRYNDFISKIIEIVLEYYETNMSAIKTNENDGHYVHFMNAFFTSQFVKDTGIVDIDKDRLCSYYTPCDKRNVENYRILHSKEIKNKKDTNDDLKIQLKNVLGIKYEEALVVKTDNKWILNDYTSKDFMKLCKKINYESGQSRFLLFDLPTEIKLYIERDEVTKEIKKSLQNHDIVVITGIKGCGKTQLAINIGTHEAKNSNVFWIDCSSKSYMEKSIFLLYHKTFHKKVDEESSLETIVSKIYSKYHKSPNLIIFNNVENISQVEKIIPERNKVSNWKTLITSTTSNWRKYTSSIINLEIMNEDEAVNLFQKFIHYFIHDHGLDDLCECCNGQDDSLNKEITTLLSHVPKYPLVIRQVAAYIFTKLDGKINKDQHTLWKNLVREEIDSYIKHHESKLGEIIMFKTHPEEKSIYATILLTIGKLKQETEDSVSNNVGKAAMDVLNMMTYFAPHDVPINVFKKFCDKKCPAEQTETRQVDFFSNVIDLLEINLILKHDIKFKNMEELVQIVNYTNLQVQGNNVVENILSDALDCLNDYVRSNGLDDIIQHIASLWTHASKYEEIVKKFIASKVENTIGKTYFFHIIAQHCEVAVMENILANLRIINPKLLGKILPKENSSHRTSLHCAAESGNLAMVNLLLAHDRNRIETINNKMSKKKQWTPLHLAAKNGYKDVVDYLIEKGHKVGGVTNYGFSPVHIVATNGYNDILKQILNKDNIDGQTDYKFTPLHLACMRNHIDCVKTLLSNGANYEAQTDYGKTALHFAADRGYDEVVKELLDHDKVKSLTKIKDTKGFTPLHWAAFSGYKDVVFKLLRDKEVIDNQTSEGNTALHLAAKQGHLSVVIVLMRHNPNTKIETNAKQKAIDVTNDEKIKELLVKPLHYKKVLDKWKIKGIAY